MKCTDSHTLTSPWPSPQMLTPHWFPRWEWPTWLKPGKWHKWAMQLFINMWHYLQWLFTNMYICHLITYSCTKSIKMLWGLFLPLTNLLISLHQQSHVLLHQGTTFIHSLLWCSANFYNISQNMHSSAPVASQHWTRNQY